MEITVELPGWELYWSRLDGSAVDAAAVLRALRSAEAEARSRLTLETLSQDPVAAAVRRLFREAGCDPTRYRPSSEALLRRVLKGEELPHSHHRQ